MIRWVYIHTLLKDGIPYDVLKDMDDEEVIILYHISIESASRHQDLMAAAMSN